MQPKISESNTQYVQDTIQNYLAYKEPEKPQPVWKKTINRSQCLANTDKYLKQLL